MVNYYIYAKDFSASTSHAAYYHTNGLKTYKHFKSDVYEMKLKFPEQAKEKIVYLHWGHECVEVDEQTTLECYKERYATGDKTLPETIIMWIKENIKAGDKIKLLYIITDGLIESQSLATCLRLNEDVEYENVVFHGIHSNPSRIDLSVAASFLKGKCKVFRNCEILDNTDVSTEFDYKKITAANFATEKESLKSYIKLKYINSPKSNATALQEIEKIKKLRNRLFNEITASKKLNDTLETTDKETFINVFKNTNWYKGLTSDTYDLKVDIEKSMTTLINYIVCEKKSYAFDALKFDTKFSNEVPEENIEDVDFTTAKEIVFPDVILAEDLGIPVILLTEHNLLETILFNNDSQQSTANFSRFKSVMDCPLFLMNDKDFANSIGYFYTVEVYKQLLEQPAKLEPRSRRPFHGGLVLVETDDDRYDEFDRYNDYILSATYFNFKKVNFNIGLFYFVLWKLCDQKEWMDRNVVEQFKKYMLRRISNTKCYIGLTSLPLDPRINTSLPTALWYCVELSSYIFKDDPENFSQERLKMYHGVANHMVEILRYFDYNLDLAFIKRRGDLIKHVSILKKNPRPCDKALYLLENIFKTVNGFLICDIEKPKNMKKLNYLSLQHNELLSDDVLNRKVMLNKYVHIMNYFEESDVKICEKTFRPFFIIEKDKSYYSKLYDLGKKVEVEEIDGTFVVKYQPIEKLDFSKILSRHNLYLHYVKDNNKFPTLKEYEEYILKKKKFKDDLVTIFPVNVLKAIEDVFVSYERVIQGVSVAKFITESEKYVNRVERIKGENVRKFDNDKAITEFIMKEERGDR